MFGFPLCLLLAREQVLVSHLGPGTYDPSPPPRPYGGTFERETRFKDPPPTPPYKPPERITIPSSITMAAPSGKIDAVTFNPSTNNSANVSHHPAPPIVVPNPASSSTVPSLAVDENERLRLRREKHMANALTSRVASAALASSGIPIPGPQSGAVSAFRSTVRNTNPLLSSTATSRSLGPGAYNAYEILELDHTSVEKRAGMFNRAPRFDRMGETQANGGDTQEAGVGASGGSRRKDVPLGGPSLGGRFGKTPVYAPTYRMKLEYRLTKSQNMERLLKGEGHETGEEEDEGKERKVDDSRIYGDGWDRDSYENVSDTDNRDLNGRSRNSPDYENNSNCSIDESSTGNTNRHSRTNHRDSSNHSLANNNTNHDARVKRQNDRHLQYLLNRKIERITYEQARSMMPRASSSFSSREDIDDMIKHKQLMNSLEISSAKINPMHLITPHAPMYMKSSSQNKRNSWIHSDDSNGDINNAENEANNMDNSSETTNSNNGDNLNECDQGMIQNTDSASNANNMSIYIKDALNTDVDNEQGGATNVLNSDDNNKNDDESTRSHGNNENNANDNNTSNDNNHTSADYDTNGDYDNSIGDENDTEISKDNTTSGTSNMDSNGPISDDNNSNMRNNSISNYNKSSNNSSPNRLWGYDYAAINDIFADAEYRDQLSYSMKPFITTSNIDESRSPHQQQLPQSHTTQPPLHRTTSLSSSPSSFTSSSSSTPSASSSPSATVPISTNRSTHTLPTTKATTTTTAAHTHSAPSHQNRRLSQTAPPSLLPHPHPHFPLPASSTTTSTSSSSLIIHSSADTTIRTTALLSNAHNNNRSPSPPERIPVSLDKLANISRDPTVEQLALFHAKTSRASTPYATINATNPSITLSARGRQFTSRGPARSGNGKTTKPSNNNNSNEDNLSNNNNDELEDHYYQKHARRVHTPGVLRSRPSTSHITSTYNRSIRNSGHTSSISDNYYPRLLTRQSLDALSTSPRRAYILSVATKSKVQPHTLA